MTIDSHTRVFSRFLDNIPAGINQLDKLESIFLAAETDAPSERSMYPEGQRILLIDSEARRRQLCDRVLAADGFAVTAVAEGFSAIRVAGRRFALAVIDIDLPGSLDGFATLRQLRARQPWLKALFTGDPARRPRRLDPDRDDFIAAAFHSHELLGCVFELLQREALFSKGHDLAG